MTGHSSATGHVGEGSWGVNIGSCLRLRREFGSWGGGETGGGWEGGCSGLARGFSEGILLSTALLDCSSMFFRVWRKVILHK